jgi:hypothetical protein
MKCTKKKKKIIFLKKSVYCSRDYHNYAAFYAQPPTNSISFMNLAARISLEIYMLFALHCCCFVFLLKITVDRTQNNKISLWNTIIATIPCIRNQTAALEHMNSVARGIVLSSSVLTKRINFFAILRRNEVYFLVSHNISTESDYCIKFYDIYEYDIL